MFTPPSQRHASQLFNTLKQPLTGASANLARSLLDALTLSLQLAHPSTYSESLHSSGLFNLLIRTIVEDKVLTTISLLVKKQLNRSIRQTFSFLPVTLKSWRALP